MKAEEARKLRDDSTNWCPIDRIYAKIRVSALDLKSSTTIDESDSGKISDSVVKQLTNDGFYIKKRDSSMSIYYSGTKWDISW